LTVRLDSGGDIASGAPLEHASERIGHVTMSMPSPYTGATLGLARVKREHAAVGTSVVARLDDGTLNRKIVPMPVYDPDRIRVRS
jgi:glycine cleavage system aminomethyltransferase T